MIEHVDVAQDPALAAPRTVQLLLPGYTRYHDALRLQRDLHAQRKVGTVPDTLVLTEHAPVITLGSAADGSHLRVPPASLATRGIDLIQVERGGDVTYHGPGQLVAYPILDLRAYGRDVHAYVRALEETALNLLATFGIAGERRRGAPGVWVGTRKIASVGVHISRWVTLHGLAINVDMDLTPFELIDPCGFADLEMTSLARLLERPVPLTDALQRYIEAFEHIFAVRLNSPYPRAR